MLYDIYKEKINKKVLKDAIKRTSKNRNSYEEVLKYKEIADLFENSYIIKELWEKYVRNNKYVGNINFIDTIKIYKEIGMIMEEK